MSYQQLSEGAQQTVQNVEVAAVGAATAVPSSPQVLPGVLNAQEEIIRIVTSVRREQASCMRRWALYGLLWVVISLVGVLLYTLGHTVSVPRVPGSSVYVDRQDSTRIAGFVLIIAGPFLAFMHYLSIGLIWCCRRCVETDLDRDVAALAEEGSISRVMTWRLDGDLWDRWVHQEFSGKCINSLCCCLCFGGQIRKARAKRNGAVMVVSRHGLFIDDVRVYELLASSVLTGVEHIRWQPADGGSIVEALRVHWISERVDQHGHVRRSQHQATLWLPEGVTPPLAASRQPGGDVWLKTAKDALSKPAQEAAVQRVGYAHL